MMKISCSAASLLAFFWVLTRQCTGRAWCRTAHRPFLCLARYRTLWHTVYALAIGKEYTSMGMQQGEPWRVGFAIRAVIRRQPRANSYSCLKGAREGQSPTWQRQPQPAWLSKAPMWAKWKAGPLSFAAPRTQLNHYLLYLCLDSALTVQRGWGPTSLLHKTRHV